MEQLEVFDSDEFLSPETRRKKKEEKKKTSVKKVKRGRNVKAPPVSEPDPPWKKMMTLSSMFKDGAPPVGGRRAAAVKAAAIVEQEELDDEELELDDFEDVKEQEPVKQVLSTEAGLDVIREGEERDAELAAATKNRKGRKGVKHGSQLDPAKKKVVKNSCWVFFRSASAAEKKGYVYCILHSYVGHECKGDGRVAISNWGTPQACLTAFNCVSHLERFHGGRESNVTVDNYWKTIKEAGGQGKGHSANFCVTAGSMQAALVHEAVFHGGICVKIKESSWFIGEGAESVDFYCAKQDCV